MRLLERFDELVHALPGLWTDAIFAVSLIDESRRGTALEELQVCGAAPTPNGSPITLRVGQQGAAVPLAEAVLRRMDSRGLRGMIVLRDVRAPLHQVTRWQGGGILAGVGGTGDSYGGRDADALVWAVADLSSVPFLAPAVPSAS